MNSRKISAEEKAEILKDFEEQKRTIAVDFDGVIWPYDEGWQDGNIYAEPFKDAKSSIEQLKSMGYKIVIFTTRANSSSGMAQVKEYLNEYNIPYDKITDRKIQAKLYIDDRALKFDSWTKVIRQFNNQRIPVSELYIEFLELLAQRSTCFRTRSSTIIVKNGMIVSTGYNGNPKQVPHCDKIGCIREEQQIPSGERHELCTGAHAEINAILQASKNNIDITGSDLYTLFSPCAYCMKAVINAEIKNIYYVNKYNDKIAFKLADLADINIQQIGR